MPNQRNRGPKSNDHNLFGSEAIQQKLKKEGVKLETEADETTTGPASFVFFDPDGNTILIDQHV